MRWGRKISRSKFSNIATILTVNILKNRNIVLILLNILHLFTYYNTNFMHLSDADQVIFLFDKNMCFYSAKICYEILMKRKLILYP